MAASTGICESEDLQSVACAGSLRGNLCAGWIWKSGSVSCRFCLRPSDRLLIVIEAVLLPQMGGGQIAQELLQTLRQRGVRCDGKGTAVVGLDL